MRHWLRYRPPFIVSRKWTFQLSLRLDVAERRGDAALGHHGVRLAEERLADEPDARPLGARLDRRPQPRAARADDEHVVLVRLVLVASWHQKKPRSR